MATYSQATEIQKLSVTFAYRYWKNLTDRGRPTINRCVIELREVVGEGVAERQIRSCNTRGM